ncbi:hypothetical protein [Marinicrinis sediminis]|uniref:Uncharacterized protein n=1 Tax=Marinicrinis sediminis TaxID=1652465 RepID=A0ABW5RD56_9BACL
MSQLYYVLSAVFILIGALATIMVALSRKNKEGNPEYDQKTKKYWTRLSVFYIVGTILFAVLIILLVRM